MFATAVYVVVDMVNDTLTFADAGHPLPIVLEGDEYRQLSLPKEQKSPALGLMRETRYFNQCMKLSDFSEILLFTDGIYETVNKEDEELGIDGVVKILQDNMSDTAKTTKELLSSLKKYSHNGEFNDDVCLMSIKSQTRKLKGV